MPWQMFSILVLLLCLTHAQKVVEVKKDGGSASTGVKRNSVGGTGGSAAAGLNADINVVVPNLLSTGVQLTKQLPYVEVLRLVEAFLKLKGELGNRFWTLIYDNAHILTALRDTLVSKIATLHNLTLSAIIILRKVFEFASYLFSGTTVSVNSSGSLFQAGVTLG